MKWEEGPSTENEEWEVGLDIQGRSKGVKFFSTTEGERMDQT